MTDYNPAQSFRDFDDAAYVRRTLSGDRSAYDTLVRQYAGMVHSIAMAHLQHDREAADELTQEVFLRAWLHLQKLSRAAAFPAWLTQITRNLAADWRRQERRKSGLVSMVPIEGPEVQTMASDDPGPVGLATRAEETMKLREALKRLSVEEQELLLLHYREGLTQSEIARRLGVNPSTVMRKLNKATGRLRTFFHSNPSILAQSENYDKLVRRTGAIVAAAWALSTSQRETLAQVALSSLAVPTGMELARFQAGSTAGKAVIATTLAALSVVGVIMYNQADKGKVADNEGQGANFNSRDVVIGVIDTEKVRPNSQTAFSPMPEKFEQDRLKTTSVLSATADNSMSVVQTAAGSIAPTGLEANKTPDFEKWPGSIAGQVLDEEGNPLAGVRVSFSVYTNAAQNPGSSPAPAGMQLNQPVHQSGSKLTDSAGRFHLDFKTSGVAVIYTDQEPYVRTLQKVSLPEKDLKIELTTSGAAKAEGKVLDLLTGDPVPGVDVGVEIYALAEWNSAPDAQHLAIYGGYNRVRTNDEGVYNIDRMPAAPVELNAWSDTRGPSVPTELLGGDKYPVLLADQKTRLPDIYVFEGYTMKGYVRDRVTKEPVVGAFVGPSEGRRIVGIKGKAATTDENGYYEVSGLKPRVSKAHKGLPEGLSFDPISVKIGDQTKGMIMPRIEGGFDPNNLIIEHDFSIRQ